MQIRPFMVWSGEVRSVMASITNNFDLNVMNMDKVSKNIYKGERILDVREIERLANEQKSIVQEVGHINVRYVVRPAAFYLGWPLRLILNTKFYYGRRDGVKI